MHDTLIERAERSIHDVHQLIHTVFTRPTAETRDVLEQLMAMFADDFSMVTTAGALVDRTQVGQMFDRVAGTRVGLEMLVSDVQVVWQAGSGVALRYKETHRLPGVEQVRYSLVIVRCSAQSIVWQCLHETALG